MSIIGDKFSRNEVFVPEMLVAARAMAAGTAILKPLLAEEGAKPLGKAAIGTVKGDMHDIGKNLVRMMLEGKGIEVDDLGVDVAPEVFVEYVQAHPDCQIVCCSALLTTTMPDLCQDFGHGNSRFYAAIAIALSIGFVRSKNASITSAGIL